MALGRPIGELQETLSWAEYEMWIEYRIKYGPLNPVRMYDQGAAVISSHMNNIHGGKAKPQDFMFYGKDEQDLQKEASSVINNFVKSLGGSAKVGKRR